MFASMYCTLTFGWISKCNRATLISAAVLARYSLFVLKVPLNSNQPTNLTPLMTRQAHVSMKFTSTVTSAFISQVSDPYSMTRLSKSLSFFATLRVVEHQVASSGQPSWNPGNETRKSLTGSIICWRPTVSVVASQLIKRKLLLSPTDDAFLWNQSCGFSKKNLKPSHSPDWLHYVQGTKLSRIHLPADF